MLGPSSAGPLLAEAVGLEGAGGMSAAGAKKGSAPEEAVEGSTVSCSRPEKRSAGSGKEPELHGREAVVTTRVIAQSLKTCRTFCKRACEVQERLGILRVMQGSLIPRCAFKRVVCCAM